MLANWNETSTWNIMTNGVDETNGIEAVQINTVDCSNEGIPRIFDDIDVTQSVQAWANGQPNYGFAFLPIGPDGWRWVSSENATLAERPALIIDFRVEGLCQIVQNPEPVAVETGYPFELRVLAQGADLRYQWYFDPAGPPVIFSPVTSATNHIYRVNAAKLSDAGSYYVVVRGWDSVCTSSTAQVTVFCHNNPPSLLSAIGNADQTTITVAFNDTLDVASAQNATNYTISGGLSIVSASIIPTNYGNEVLLTTSGPREIGRNYELTIRNLRDNSACRNVMYPNPTVLMLTQDVRLLSFDKVWKYHNDGFDLGTAWRQPQYNDSTWPEGPGLLGFETQADTIAALSNQNLSVGTPLRRSTPSGQPIMTDYFRTLVNVPFDVSSATFQIRHVVDDGAIFYFNGVEAARFNMPTGLVNSSTRAIIAPAEGVVRTLTNLAGLSCGQNSLAVEVHQQTDVSNDVLFGAELIGRFLFFVVPVCGGHLHIRQNDDGTITISWYAPTAILQEADDLNGEWRYVVGAASPWTVPSLGASRFYRLR